MRVSPHLAPVRLAPVRLAVALLALLVAAPLAAQPVHSVWSDKPLALRDGEFDTWLSPDSGNAALAWQEGTSEAFANAQATSGSDSYEFRLIAVGASDDQEISGLWDIYRNNSLRCAACVGKAYGLNQSAGVGNYFKIYVGDALGYAEDWHWSGYITARFDY